MRHDTTSSKSLLAAIRFTQDAAGVPGQPAQAPDDGDKLVRRRTLSSKGADFMYIAMNRFKVAPGSESAFEDLWTSRDTHLKEVPGFVEFHLLKGPQKEDHVLYSSHTIWSDYDAFEGWTKSDAFRAAHRNAGNETRSLYLGHPEFEGFEVIQTVK